MINFSISFINSFTGSTNRSTISLLKSGKPVDISAINVVELECWICESSDRQNAIKCQGLIALTKNVSVTSVCTVLDITRETLLEYLPKYAPKVNPIERHWWYLRKATTKNVLFETSEKCWDTIKNHFAN